MHHGKVAFFQKSFGRLIIYTSCGDTVYEALFGDGEIPVHSQLQIHRIAVHLYAQYISWNI